MKLNRIQIKIFEKLSKEKGIDADDYVNQYSMEFIALGKPFKRSLGSVSIPDSLAVSAMRTILAPQFCNFSINAILSIDGVIE